MQYYHQCSELLLVELLLQGITQGSVTCPAGAWVEQHGAISAVPSHDGTECLKWDDSLWTHQDHFKVRRRV